MGARWIWLAGLAAAALLLALPAAGRPLAVDDLLRMEGLGKAELSAGNGVLVIERRTAYADGARFDYGDYSDLFRTRIEVVDTRKPAPPALLFPHEPGVGYTLGPLSPDGRRVVVWRLKAGRWELGVADVDRGGAAWTGIASEISETGRTVAWASPGTLAIIALPGGLQPFALRISNPGAAVIERWGRAAGGGAAITVVGSGAQSAINPRDPAATLVLLDVETGTRRRLVDGRFKDLELSASGRWAALTEAGEDIPLVAGKQIRGEYGTAKRRQRLVLVELPTGRALRPCPPCDISRQLLAWSPVADELLVFARHDGETWPQGRLLKVFPEAGALLDLTRGRLEISSGGAAEAVAAGWAGDRVIAYARPVRSGRPPSARGDWWELGQQPPRALTAALSPPEPAGAAAAGDRLLVRIEGGAAEVSLTGKILRRLGGEIDIGPTLTQALTPRFANGLRGGHGETALWRRHGRTALAQFDAEGLHAGPRAPADAELIVGDGDVGALIRRPGPGGADRFAWLGRTGRTTWLFTLNRHLANVARPEVRAVPHQGPGGQPLVSWLVLPTARIHDGPPPLVVWPYLNLAYPRPPAFLEPRELPNGAAVQLLAGHGYAVLLPSLPVARNVSAPSEGAAHAVLAIIEAAARQPDLKDAFDADRLGLWGHSFGGYSIAAIAGQTDRFRAGVTWAAAGPDLFAKWGDFGLPRRVWPQDGLANPSWTEDLQGDTRGPPWATTGRYLAGSPLLQLGSATTPLLIAHGDQDGFPIAGSEQLFSAYYRRGAEAMMATYWGEGHVLRSPAHLIDFYARGLRWLDEHLGFTPPDARPGTASLVTKGPTP